MLGAYRARYKVLRDRVDEFPLVSEARPEDREWYNSAIKDLAELHSKIEETHRKLASRERPFEYNGLGERRSYLSRSGEQGEEEMDQPPVKHVRNRSLDGKVASIRTESHQRPAYTGERISSLLGETTRTLSSNESILSSQSLSHPRAQGTVNLSPEVEKDDQSRQENEKEWNRSYEGQYSHDIKQEEDQYQIKDEGERESIAKRDLLSFRPIPDSDDGAEVSAISSKLISQHRPSLSVEEKADDSIQSQQPQDASPDTHQEFPDTMFAADQQQQQYETLIHVDSTYSWGPFIEHYLFRLFTLGCEHLRVPTPLESNSGPVLILPEQVLKTLDGQLINDHFELRKRMFASTEEILKWFRDEQGLSSYMGPNQTGPQMTWLAQEILRQFVGLSDGEGILVEQGGELFKGELQDYLCRLVHLCSQRFQLEVGSPRVMDEDQFDVLENHYKEHVREMYVSLYKLTNQVLVDLYPGLLTNFVPPSANSSLPEFVRYGKRPPVDEPHELAAIVSLRIRRMDDLWEQGEDLMEDQMDEIGEMIGRRYVIENEQKEWINGITQEEERLGLELSNKLFSKLEDDVLLEVNRVLTLHGWNEEHNRHRRSSTNPITKGDDESSSSTDEGMTLTRLVNVRREREDQRERYQRNEYPHENDPDLLNDDEDEGLTSDAGFPQQERFGDEIDDAEEDEEDYLKNASYPRRSRPFRY